MVYRCAIVLFLSAWLALATDYYLDPVRGTNTAAGTSTNVPWKTLTKAGTTMRGGDTLYVRGRDVGIFDTDRTLPAAQGGGQFFSPGYHSVNTNLFTEAAPCIITNYPGERPLFINGNLDGIGVPPFIIGFNQWIKVFGMDFTNCRGASISIIGCTNIEIAYNGGGPTATQNVGQSVLVLDSSKHCWIHDNYFHEATGFAANPTNQIEVGDVFPLGVSNWQYLTSAVNCAYNVIENNFMHSGGHTVLNPQGCVSNFIRGNIIRNPVWIDWPSFGQKGGHRCVGAFGGWNVIEDNDLGFAGNPLMNDGAEGLGIFGQRNIIAFNVLTRNENNGITLYDKGIGALGGWWVTNNAVVHNTMAHNALGQSFFTNYYNPGRGIGPITNNAKCVVFLSGAADSKFGNNIFAKNGGFNGTNDFQFRGGTLGSNALALAITNWFDHVTGDPLFANDTNDLYYWGNFAGNPYGTNARQEFQLKSSSPCIDKGGWLTTTASGGSGTSLQVGDSRFFWAGVVACGRTFIGKTSVIQLEGQNSRAIVTAVDGATHTLTLDRPLAWSAGQGVSYAYSGSAPDFGAFEYVPGSTISITGQSPGGTNIVATFSGGVTIR